MVKVIYKRKTKELPSEDDGVHTCDSSKRGIKSAKEFAKQMNINKVYVYR